MVATAFRVSSAIASTTQGLVLSGPERSHPAVVSGTIRRMVEIQETSSKQTRRDLDGSLAGDDPHRGLHRDPVRGRLTDIDRALVWLVSIVSAAGAAAVHAHPTGSGVSDVLVAVFFGGFVAAAASRARPWALAVASGIAAAAGSGPWVVVACVALAVCLVDAMVIDVPHRRVLGALVGAVDVQVLLRMPEGRLAVNSLAAVVAVGCIVWSGRELALARIRHRSKRVWIVAGTLVALAVVSLLLSALHARHAVDVGIDRAERGLRAAAMATATRQRDCSTRRAGHSDRRTTTWAVGGRSRRCCSRASASKRRRWISCRKVAQTSRKRRRLQHDPPMCNR